VPSAVVVVEERQIVGLGVVVSVAPVGVAGRVLVAVVGIVGRPVLVALVVRNQ